MAGSFGDRGFAAYGTAKGALIKLTRHMAQDLAPKIRVNSVSPGAIKTPINQDAWSTPEAEAQLLKLIPHGRVGETHDIARAVVWLASDLLMRPLEVGEVAEGFGPQRQEPASPRGS